MSRPTIVHAITRLENGGAQRHALHIVENLPKDKFRVVLAYGPGGYLDPVAHTLPEVELWPIAALQRSLKPTADLSALWQFRSKLKELRGSPIIVQTHSSKVGVLGRLGASFSGVKARIHTVHGFGFHAGSSAFSQRLLKHVEKRSARFSDWNLCVSEHDLRFGVRHGLLQEDNSSIIHAGVDLDAHAPDPKKGLSLRTELGIEPNARVISTIACLKPQKAPLDFVRCARRIHELLPDVHFIYVGDGELKSALLEEVESVGRLRDKFHFLGWTERINHVLSASNLFLLLSLWEGLPRALIEARAAGLPCVATRICGNPEAVVDGVNGLLVPPGRPASAAEHVVRLFKHPELLQELARNTSLELDQFHIKHVVPAHVEIYGRFLRD